MTDDERTTPRREFLWQLSAAAAAAKLALGQTVRAEDTPIAASPLPSIQLGAERISRLVAGWNPIGGHSHTTLDMSLAMREYFTVPRTAEFLKRCQHNGITTWQCDHSEKATEALRTVRREGMPLKVLVLHAERLSDAPLKKVVEDLAPIAIVHHGGETDRLFSAGKSGQVRDFVKKVRDLGLLAGVSSHHPAHIRRIADEGWENDFFMCSFYCISRSPDEQRQLLGCTTVGEPFLESDPLDMTKVIREVPKPCLGFKILAAGRLAWNKPSVEKSFRFAFQNIKPIDGVIVGMFPRYSDQVAEDAALARKFGTGRRS